MNECVWIGLFTGCAFRGFCFKCKNVVIAWFELPVELAVYFVGWDGGGIACCWVVWSSVLD